jgi:hypothetical protein
VKEKRGKSEVRGCDQEDEEERGKIVVSKLRGKGEVEMSN